LFGRVNNLREGWVTIGNQLGPEDVRAYQRHVQEIEEKRMRKIIKEERKK
jgi:N6-adenosine-specific RNA methylase IME4